MCFNHIKTMRFRRLILLCKRLSIKRHVPFNGTGDVGEPLHATDRRHVPSRPLCVVVARAYQSAPAPLVMDSIKTSSKGFVIRAPDISWLLL